MKILKTIMILGIATFSSVGLSSFTTKPVPEKKNFTFNYTYNVQFMGEVQPDPAKAEYFWTWAVSNPNPGDGRDGITLQNLSHWNLAIADVVTRVDVMAVQYSYNGTSWSNLPIEFVIDKSTDECYANMILKFDAGTTGSAPTYYRLVVNKDFHIGTSMAVFKSGSRTGCDTGIVESLATTPGEDIITR